MSDTTNQVAQPETDQRTDETPAGNVIEAIRRVMRDIPLITKERHAPGEDGERGLKFPYRSIEQITPHTQDLFARHGVLLAPYRITSWDVREVMVGNPPKPWTDDRLQILWRAYGPGGREDFIEVETAGIGRDGSDKGSNKATTGSMKEALLTLLQIAGDDPDAYQDNTATNARARPAGGSRRRTPEGREPEGGGDAGVAKAVIDKHVEQTREAGITDEQHAALVSGVTGGRTSDVYEIHRGEYDPLRRKVREAVEARRARTPGEAPSGPVEPVNGAGGVTTPEPSPEALEALLAAAAPEPLHRPPDGS